MVATRGAIYPDLEGKRVIVTGGGGGIGAAITRAFVRQKALVAFLDLAERESMDLVAELGGAAAGVSFHKVDLRDIPALQSAISAIHARQGDTDVLINNAGWDERQSISELTPEFFDTVLAINLKHAVFAAQAVLPGMKSKKNGVIVNFSSISWMAGMGGMPAYTAAKSAMLGLTRSLARDHGVDNIRVNAVAPGWTETKRQMERWWSPEGDKQRLEAQALKRWVTPDHVARLVVFLSSQEAEMCTGQHFVVDGGWV
jgi:NAD(P)-dependent dehydrogenase (short-subunit alcohol dehydrogenase family)